VLLAFYVMTAKLPANISHHH